MTKKVSKIVGGLTGVIVGGVGGLLLIPDISLISQTNRAAPQETFDLVAFILLTSALYFVNGWMTRRTISQSRLGEQRERLPLRRPTATFGTIFLRYQLVLVFVFLVWLRGESWTPQSVGFKQELPNLVALFSGVVAYLLMIALLHVGFHLAGTYASQADSTVLNMARLWPRNLRQKRVMAIAVCLLNPVTEELMYRGILVHQFGLALGGYEVPLLVGLIVSLANHAYQGIGAIALHAFFYAVAVGLLLSPAGLMGSIGMHFAGDILPVALMSRNLKEYRERHRQVVPGEA